MKILKRYRKAIGAGLGTFLVGFPLVPWVSGDNVGDAGTLAKTAAAGAVVAIITGITPKNADPA